MYAGQAPLNCNRHTYLGSHVWGINSLRLLIGLGEHAEHAELRDGFFCFFGFFLFGKGCLL